MAVDEEDDVGEGEFSSPPLDLLADAANTVVRHCMEIGRHENVLIIADSTTLTIAIALWKEANEISDRVLMVAMPPSERHGAEPPTPVADLMRKQNVVIAPTLHSLTHTRARLTATKEGARIATMPGITEDIFTHGGLSADFKKIKNEMGRLGPRLRGKGEVAVTSPSGTNVTFQIDPRKWNREDNGICNRPGMVTNLPAGKVFNMPKEGTMNGRLVVDGSFDSTLLTKPLTFEVENGLVTSISGGSEADEVTQMYEEAAQSLKPKQRESVWNVAEFGFGMNEKAGIIGNVLEDEKNLGSCYFAIGDNSTMGGKVSCGIHVTGVIRTPTVTLSGKPFLADGELLRK